MLRKDIPSYEPCAIPIPLEEIPDRARETARVMRAPTHRRSSCRYALRSPRSGNTYQQTFDSIEQPTMGVCTCPARVACWHLAAALFEHERLNISAGDLVHVFDGLSASRAWRTVRSVLVTNDGRSLIEIDDAPGLFFSLSLVSRIARAGAGREAA